METMWPRVIVAGSLAIDLACDFVSRKGLNTLASPQLHTSNPAAISQALGGVGHNITTAIHYLNTDVNLCSVVGDDQAGMIAKGMLATKGIPSSGVTEKANARTAQYVAVNDSQKNLVLAMADMAILEECQSQFDATWKPYLDGQKPKWIVVDANWDSATLQKWLGHGKATTARIAFEPVSVVKSQRLFAYSPETNFDLGIAPDHSVSLTAPNSLELTSMHAAAQEAGIFDREGWWQVIDAMALSSSGSRDKLISMTNVDLVNEGIPQQAIQLLPIIPTILTKLGHRGVLMTQILKPGDDRLTSRAHSRYILSRSDISHGTIGGVYMRLFPPAETVPSTDIVSVNGVGDTFLGIIIAGLSMDNPKPLVDLINIAQQGSVMTLRSNEAVSPEIISLRTLL
ncbi:MAG: hypothetical protein Q9219_002969 [cf. Caloplaca sp. 3 TL-2023]